MLMHGKKLDAGPVHQNILRAVAVMNVKIKHGHALGAGGLRFQNGNGHVVKITKAHRLVRRVAWWPGGRMRLKTVWPARASFSASSAAATEARA